MRGVFFSAFPREAFGAVMIIKCVLGEKNYCSLFQLVSPDAFRMDKSIFNFSPHLRKLRRAGKLKLI